MSNRISRKDAAAPRGAGGRSLATRLKLIRVAEKLFAELGIEAAPLRAICEAAGQKNTMSVQYHFGDRMGLLRAIFDQREGELADMRRRLFNEIVKRGDYGDIKGLLRVIFQPYLEIYRAEGSVDYLKIIALYLLHYRPKGVRHPVDDTDESNVIGRSLGLMRRRLYFVDDELFAIRISNVGVIFMSAFIQHMERGEKSRIPVERLLEDTLDTMAAAMCAPPWPESQA